MTNENSAFVRTSSIVIYGREEKAIGVRREGGRMSQASSERGEVGGDGAGEGEDGCWDFGELTSGLKMSTGADDI